jgi:hypothetical protein
MLNNILGQQRTKRYFWGLYLMGIQVSGYFNNRIPHMYTYSPSEVKSADVSRGGSYFPSGEIAHKFRTDVMQSEDANG